MYNYFMLSDGLERERVLDALLTSYRLGEDPSESLSELWSLVENDWTLYIPLLDAINGYELFQVGDTFSEEMMD